MYKRAGTLASWGPEEDRSALTFRDSIHDFCVAHRDIFVRQDPEPFLLVWITDIQLETCPRAAQLTRSSLAVVVMARYIYLERNQC
jgi:hypothetical protein